MKMQERKTKNENFRTYMNLLGDESNQSTVVEAGFGIVQNDNLESLKIEFDEIDERCEKYKKVKLIICNLEGLIRLRNMISGIIKRRFEMIEEIRRNKQ